MCLILYVKKFEKNFNIPKKQKKILITIDDAFQSFYEVAWPFLKENKTIKDKISEEELVELFDENYHTKNTDFIFNRVFKDE